uniref:Translocase of outer mitochondrial membrane 40 homolog (yeast) n=1 Tax=Gouania willdenowi TaxID=441366 RepID=A0A8C5DGY5_GOUWI
MSLHIIKRNTQHHHLQEEPGGALLGHHQTILSDPSHPSSLTPPTLLPSEEIQIKAGLIISDEWKLMSYIIFLFYKITTLGAPTLNSSNVIPFQSFPVIVGDMDNTGSLNAQVIHQLSTAIRSKVAIQKFVNWQCDVEFPGQNFTSAVTFGNPDVVVGSALALGEELVYHRRPGEEGTVTSLLGRYTGENYVATLTVGGAGAHATYYHKANDQLQVGVQFEANSQKQETLTSLGNQLDVPKANLIFKGTVDSNWVVGAMLEKKLPPASNKFQCGFGVTIG